MKKLNQQGVVDSWLIAFILTAVLLVGALGFGMSMFSSRQDYKNNTDTKISAAVEDAEKKLSEKKEVEFAEKEKNPLRTYTGPTAYGSLTINYPKTWAAYIDESGKSSSSSPVDGYLNPAFVPGLQTNSNVALRFQVINSTYATNARSLEALVKSGKIRTTPFVAAKVPSAIGVRGEGEIMTGKTGALVLLPLRDKTLKIWTEASQFVPDFNDIILPTLTFVP